MCAEHKELLIQYFPISLFAENFNHLRHVKIPLFVTNLGEQPQFFHPKLLPKSFIYIGIRMNKRNEIQGKT